MKQEDAFNEISMGRKINLRTTSELENVRRSGILNYRSESMPTWCPGCGYYGITLSLSQALNSLNIASDRFVVVSGIGCAGRYPFFVNGYGFHTIHGRTLPIACGVKMANPDLFVMAVAGDGDALAIGGGHLPHAIRRNIDMTYVIFDNGIYGLTKGQASPTTPRNQKTKTTPYGNPETPVNPLLTLLAYGATFVATGYAGLPEPLTGIFIRAFQHKGFSVVLVTTPCVTFDHVNILYPRHRELWQPIGPDHDAADLGSAFRLALTSPYRYGVVFEQPMPTWQERQDEIVRRAKSDQ